jgi:hypothetical protein
MLPIERRRLGYLAGLPGQIEGLRQLGKRRLTHLARSGVLLPIRIEIAIEGGDELFGIEMGCHGFTNRFRLPSA